MPITAGEARQALRGIACCVKAMRENQRHVWLPVHTQLLREIDLAVRRRGFNSALDIGLVGPLFRLVSFCATHIAFQLVSTPITAAAVGRVNPESVVASLATPVSRGRHQGSLSHIRKGRNVREFWARHLKRYRELLAQGLTTEDARSLIKRSALNSPEGQRHYPDGIVSPRTLRKYLTNGKGRGRPPAD